MPKSKLISVLSVSVIIIIFIGLIEVFSFLLLLLANSTLVNESIRKSRLSQLHELGLPDQYIPRGIQNSGPRSWPAMMSASPAYKEFDWATEFWMVEHKRYKSYSHEASNIFQPNVIWRNKPINNKFVKINEEGIRNTCNSYMNSSKDTRNVFLFGGSTVYGTGVPDKFTIPSQLSKHLNEKGDIFYNVTNFGTGGFILEQDMQLLFDEIRKGNLPDIAVFYHGVNDAYAGVYSPGKPGWYLGSEELKNKLYYSKSNIINNTWYEQLHAYELLRHFKVKLLRMLYLTGQKDSEFYLDDYQQRAGHFVGHYRETIKIIKAVCDSYGIKVLFIWQPVLFYGNKPLNEFEKSMIDNPALLAIGTFRSKDGLYQKKAIETTYRLLEKTSLSLYPNFYNFSHIFDRSGNEPIYIDWMHLGPKGNDIVAREIANIIKH